MVGLPCSLYLPLSNLVWPWLRGGAEPGGPALAVSAVPNEVGRCPARSRLPRSRGSWWLSPSLLRAGPVVAHLPWRGLAGRS